MRAVQKFTIRHWRGWVLCSLLLYALALSVIAFWPTPVDGQFSGALTRLLQFLHAHGVPDSINYSFVERTANVLLFIPAGCLIGLLLPRRFWWLAALVCMAVSMTIEFMQALFLPARFASLTDVATNSTGGVVGAIMSVWVQHAILQKRSR